MKYAEINKRFTEIVSEHITKGYTINTASMGGSQGEIAKIDLTDGNEIIRIEIRPFHDFGKPTNGIKIVTGRSLDNATPNTANSKTVWSGNLDIISVERFYSLDGRSDGEYGTYEEAIRE